ncbi:nitronate monooxygenase [Klebsiella pneumoniae subsp. pneumoniae]|nr:nitronate monooxygenase [Klebsiella pneumoniae subsp. pneumoniae]
MVVAQGYEAGGHRGIFAPQAPDAQLSTFTPGATSAASTNHPGGGRRGHRGRSGIASVMQLGAQGVQLGTAFFTVSGIGRRRRLPRGDPQQP